MFIQTASAISVGVSPHSLQFNVGEGAIQKNITIVNNGNEISSYELYADSDYSGLINISPSEFFLSPGMTREVTVSYVLSVDTIGNVTFKLNLAAKPAGNELVIGAGIRIPVTVISEASDDISGMSFFTAFSHYIRANF